MCEIKKCYRQIEYTINVDFKVSLGDVKDIRKEIIIVGKTELPFNKKHRLRRYSFIFDNNERLNSDKIDRYIKNMDTQIIKYINIELNTANIYSENYEKVYFYINESINRVS